MIRFLFTLCFLGGLVLAGVLFKDKIQDFIKEGLNNNSNTLISENTSNKNNEKNTNTNENSPEVNVDLKGNNALAQFTNASNLQKVDKKQSKYEYTYIFRNPENKGVLLKWQTPQKETDAVIKEFGLPLDFFEKPRTQPEIDLIYKKGYHTNVTYDNTTYASPDYSRLANRHKPFTKPLYNAIKQSLGKNVNTTNMVEALMTFYQDIPYKIPPDKRGKKLINGLDVPAKLFLRKVGDCDTKSLAFVSTLLHHPNTKTVLITVEGHMFAGVRGTPTAYQSSVTFQGEKYIICEPVGNARLKVGELAFKDRKVKHIAKIANEK